MSRRRYGVLKNQKGQGMVEYIIIVALIALAAVMATAHFGGGVQAMWAKLTATLTGETQLAQEAEAIAKSAAEKAKNEANDIDVMNNFEDIQQ